MVLFFEKTLETIVNSENEVKIAIEALREKAPALIEKVEDSSTETEPTKEDLETLSPVIEQQLDPESYESTSYSIDVGHGSSTYSGGKTYYELANGEDGKPIGASFTAIMSEHEEQQKAFTVSDRHPRLGDGGESKRSRQRRPKES